MVVDLEINELKKEVKLRESVCKTAARAYGTSPSTMYEDHLGIQKIKLRRSYDKLKDAIRVRNAHPVKLLIGDHT